MTQVTLFIQRCSLRCKTGPISLCWKMTLLHSNVATSIKDCGTCAVKLWAAAAGGRVHLVTGLTQGQEEASAPAFLDG